MPELVKNLPNIELEELEIKQRPRAVSPEDLEAAGISADTFQLDYTNYVEWYEEKKREGRALSLAAIQAMADKLAETNDPAIYARRLQEFNNFADPINQAWGREFDDDIIKYLEVLLIMHKDLTIVMRPGTRLYWYDRLMGEINGKPPEDDAYFQYDEDKGENNNWYQEHPGRPDRPGIKINTYEQPDSTTKMRHLALVRTVEYPN